MAPELWSGAKVSVASDIYALGVILRELKSGRSSRDLPVTSSTLPSGKRLTRVPPFAHRKWDRIVARCLDPDPKRRFQSVDKVAQALGPSPARKWLLAVGSSVLLALSSGGAVYQRTVNRQETVRLAFLGFTASKNISSLSQKVLRDTATQLAHLKSRSRPNLEFIPLDEISYNEVDASEKARALERPTY
jgi:serine/threonine protein kinase